MKSNEIAADNPIAIAIAGTPAIQNLATWSRASAIAFVMTNLQENAFNQSPEEFEKTVESILASKMPDCAGHFYSGGLIGRQINGQPTDSFSRL